MIYHNEYLSVKFNNSSTYDLGHNEFKGYYISFIKVLLQFLNNPDNIITKKTIYNKIKHQFFEYLIEYAYKFHEKAIFHFDRNLIRSVFLSIYETSKNFLTSDKLTSHNSKKTFLIGIAKKIIIEKTNFYFLLNVFIGVFICASFYSILMCFGLFYLFIPQILNNYSHYNNYAKFLTIEKNNKLLIHE